MFQIGHYGAVASVWRQAFALPPLSQRTLRSGIRAQTWAIAVGTAVVICGVIILSVPGHLGLDREGWILAGGCLCTAGVGNVVVASLARWRYRVALRSQAAEGS